MTSHIESFVGGAYLSEVATPASLVTAGVTNVLNNKGVDSASAKPEGMTSIENVN